MCSEPPCQNGFLVPQGDSVQVPENALGFWWRAARDSDAAAGESVVATLIGTPETPARELTVTRTWVPPSTNGSGEAQPGGVLLGVPLMAGQHLHLEAADTCAIGGRTPFVASVAVTPASPVPTHLGSLAASAAVHGPLAVASDGGGCSRERETVHVDVSLTLDRTAQPWADLLLYETRVDGALYAAAASAIHGPPPHESWQGRGSDRLFALCEGVTSATTEPAGLAPGPHEVQLVARLPGSDTRIASDTLHVELICPGVPNAEAAEALYSVATLQIGGVVVAAQLALLIYILMTRSRRRRGRPPKS